MTCRRCWNIQRMTFGGFGVTPWLHNPDSCGIFFTPTRVSWASYGKTFNVSS